MTIWQICLLYSCVAWEGSDVQFIYLMTGLTLSSLPALLKSLITAENMHLLLSYQRIAQLLSRRVSDSSRAEGVQRSTVSEALLRARREVRMAGWRVFIVLLAAVSWGNSCRAFGSREFGEQWLQLIAWHSFNTILFCVHKAMSTSQTLKKITTKPLGDIS